MKSKITYQKVTSSQTHNQLGFANGKLLIATGDKLKSLNLPEVDDKIN
jgi:hypothetical protein